MANSVPFRLFRYAIAGVAICLVAGLAAPGTLTPIGSACAEQSPQIQVKDTKPKRKLPPKPVAPGAEKPAAPVASPAGETPQPVVPPPPERNEADVSARSIAVTAAFKGSEVTVFGTVDNSRQPSPESGYYDVIVAVEGAPAPAVVRRKSNVAGLWVNSAVASFDRTPSFYAVASTRPLEEIADGDVLSQNSIGIDNIPLTASPVTLGATRGSELRDFQAALGRLKLQEGLYTRDDYGVTFSGRSLFRSTLAVPANVPVGQLVTRIYLFREGELLNKFTTRVSLERTGVERFIYDAAHASSWLYGIVAVLLALACGLIASAIFDRRSL